MTLAVLRFEKKPQNFGFIRDARNFGWIFVGKCHCAPPMRDPHRFKLTGKSGLIELKKG